MKFGRPVAENLLHQRIWQRAKVSPKVSRSKLCAFLTSRLLVDFIYSRRNRLVSAGVVYRLPTDSELIQLQLASRKTFSFSQSNQFSRGSTLESPFWRVAGRLWVKRGLPPKKAFHENSRNEFTQVNFLRLNALLNRIQSNLGFALHPPGPPFSGERQCRVDPPSTRAHRRRRIFAEPGRQLDGFARGRTSAVGRQVAQGRPSPGRLHGRRRRR